MFGGLIAGGLGLASSLWGANQDRKAANKAIKAQKSQNKANQAFIREQAAKARQDILPLFGDASENRLLGSQAALDIFGQAVPQQINAFQQGNIGAQQSLLAGLPQIQNAILGMPVDYSALSAQSIQPDLSMFNQQLPNFNTALPDINPIQEPVVNNVAPQIQQAPQQPTIPYYHGAGGRGMQARGRYIQQAQQRQAQKERDLAAFNDAALGAHNLLERFTRGDFNG